MTQTLSLIALGSNLSSSTGCPETTLRAALGQIAAMPGCKLAAVSRFYRNPAFPAGSGPDYVNACAALRTTLGADELLNCLHGIEARMGRLRPARWSARAIDLDLLAVGNAVFPDNDSQDRWRGLAPDRQLMETPASLILPHPRLQDRAFVLVPLSEIAPDWVHPRTGASVAEMCAALTLGQRSELVAFA